MFEGNHDIRINAAGQHREPRLHAFEDGKKIDRSGTGGGEQCYSPREAYRKRSGPVRLAHAKHDAERCSNTNSRSPANAQGPDRLGDDVNISRFYIPLFSGKQGLVDES